MRFEIIITEDEVRLIFSAESDSQDREVLDKLSHCEMLSFEPCILVDLTGIQGFKKVGLGKSLMLIGKRPEKEAEENND